MKTLLISTVGVKYNKTLVSTATLCVKDSTCNWSKVSWQIIILIIAFASPCASTCNQVLQFILSPEDDELPSCNYN